jgi:phosphatidylglycerol:prolipoprotein diacylglycerol transferase
MTHTIHNLNPIVLELGGPLAIRWYGLSYLAGFIGCILLLRHWSKRGGFSVPEQEVSNFVMLLGFFGVFLGGRLGYVLLYGWDALMADPLYVFKVWDGGMSSHGGFIGVILFMIWYAKKHGHTFWNLADNMACTTSLGFAFGRLANFVNGELWGRVSDVKWAMVFPQELGLSYGEYTASSIGFLVENGELLPRHPSQLYQAFCEGFLVFGIMLLLRKTAFAKRPGALSACYLALYALARIAMEFFREPDNGQFFIGWMSKGQFYSLLLILGAGYICWKQKLFESRH